MKTIGVGVVALIIGVIGGFMLSGQQKAMSQDAVNEMMEDPTVQNMVIDNLMNNEEAKSMIETKLMRVEDNTVKEDPGMMEEEDSMMEK